MLRKGFTLIELLIVITIIAILAGAAIPYVADYIEQAKVARANVDMSRIRDALTRWELDRATWDVTEDSTAKLVGPYLQKAAVDPWGQPYVINSYMSLIYSFGPDQTEGFSLGDDIALNFRPRMAATKVQWIDNTGDGEINIGDQIIVSCTRPALLATDDASGVSIQLGAAPGELVSALSAGSTVVVSGRKVAFPITVDPIVATTVSGCPVSILAPVAVDGTDSIYDQSMEAANPAVGVLAWSSSMALKPDVDLVLQSE